MLLTRQQILEAQDLKREKVNVPEWGGDVYVKTLTGSERDKFESSIFGSDKKSTSFKDLRAKFVVAVTVDKDGKAIFSQADIAALGGKSSRALDAIFAVGQKLSGITKEDVDDMTKNS